MKKREASFGVMFRHWLRANPMRNAAFELKQTQTLSIPFSTVYPHQLDALLAVKSPQGILWKISDESRGAKPFDMFYLREAQAYVVIRYPEIFVLIDVEDFIREKNFSLRKSLTRDRAMEISYKIIQFHAKHK